MKLRREFVVFLLVGGFAAGVNVLSRIIFNLSFSYDVSVVLAYPVGMTVAYVLNRIYVFETSGRGVAGEYVRFGLVNVVALIQVWLVSVGLAHHLFPAIGFTWFADTIAHGIGVAVPIFTSYFGHKHFSFARRG
ncbi:GtrA family protein [Tardiphaga sp. vice278]|uniref:GtrA family protein n=1 Tax=Tardiphaga sp. vice278 TaxID=2592815 RepID=UPI001162DBB4|nr:GtrA family protein [Tardiphaga sp. vice278]QDM17985.1 GtrA family protein [Tardiphaga sp. vice278]